MFKRNKEPIEKRKVTVQKYKSFFVTTDGERHEGVDSKWGIVGRLSSTIPQYLMRDIKIAQYIEDKDGVMYPLSNVVSIKWELLEERIVEDNFHEFTVLVDAEKIRKHIKR